MSEILIISKSDFELTTNSVCDWLNYYQTPYIRLNVDKISDPKFYHIFIDFENGEMEIFDKINNKLLDLKKIKTVWCRRFIDMVYDNIIRQEKEIDENLIKFAKFHAAEKNRFLRILYDFYPHWKWFDYYKDSLKIDKIEVLRLAKKNNLNVPKTYITNCKESLSKIAERTQDLITKPIFEGISFSGQEGMYNTQTQKVRTHTVKEFAPSLFQENIRKKYELRIFYLDNKFYAMAIFSSKNKRTSIDFRNYDIFNPNRYVPYNLPKLIEQNLQSLMTDLNLYSGSIDMIKDTEGSYIFLEVNTVGQFGMVSLPCNYHLEKEVAEFLIKKTK
ncbi:grasp-with-spasm system ATP-grasp peptide maturase [uncultured Chryseobacterium sp.]|jgi:Glutathione synthase/Ribosomal protein S6 modification enzyme (glutaminyl transferase)|uniref:grasp-with-spasm system ATP-grasp peptide maturase n=1 Tax=uncultured Chryseobacterium sp. TaxID=259322 RepID=UPI002621802E|nr:grasp-with-spasm system ATP-grasp peptide maturase [uncultured Chryseobacterium sp.]